MSEGFTVWFTGLPGAGKTTLAAALEGRLRRRGFAHVQRLDGGLVRKDLSRDLGFTKADREENVRRVTFVAELLSNNGVVTLVSLTSPYRAGRAEARRRCNDFVEVFVSCPLQNLIRRDPKGHYARALAGELPSFTGIDHPYEEPIEPEVVVHTDRETVEESLQKIVDFLERRGRIHADPSNGCPRSDGHP